jgi:hypothetical protein
MKSINHFLRESNSKISLFVDMDGVLVNFEKGLESFGYGTIDEIKAKRGDSFIWVLLSRVDESFWKNLEWMPDGKELWTYCRPHNPIILSAPTNEHSSRVGKEIWVRQHLGPDIKLILEKAKDKYKHAEPGDILIDDMKPNIDGWIAAGGVGILHINTKDTISKLDKILKGQSRTK